MMSVALPSGSTVIRYSPGCRSVKARFGVSTSNTWLGSRRRTRTFNVPCVNCSWAIRSSRLRTDTAGPGVHANHRAADLNLGPRARIRPQAVAGGQRSIDRGQDPVVLAGGREADRAGRVAETRDARWRVRGCPAAAGRDGEAGHESKRPKTEGLHRHDVSFCKSLLFHSLVQIGPRNRGSARQR